MKEIIERYWPLPAPQLRKATLVPVDFINRGFRLERDGDYLCYIGFKTALFMNLAIYIAMLLDVKFRTGLIVDPAAYDANKLVLSRILEHLLAVPTIVITIAVYLRIRIPMDIKRDLIPIIIMPSVITDRPRGSWIRYSSIATLFPLLVIFLSHIVIERFTRHFHGENDEFTIGIMQVSFQVYVYAGLPAVFSASALTLEKAIRFFPEAQDDLKIRQSFQEAVQ